MDSFTIVFCVTFVVVAGFLRFSFPFAARYLMYKKLGPAFSYQKKQPLKPECISAVTGLLQEYAKTLEATKTSFVHEAQRYKNLPNPGPVGYKLVATQRRKYRRAWYTFYLWQFLAMCSGVPTVASAAYSTHPLEALVPLLSKTK